MWKFKNQTLVSVIGLAAGFTCFALATLWLVYEMTYDSFHKNAKQMYVVYLPSSLGATDYDRPTPFPLASYLKETFPEIEDAIPLLPSSRGSAVSVENVGFPASVIWADSSFLRMFDIKIMEGSGEFLIPDSRKIAVTQEKARQIFGSENPIGKTLDNGEMICAVVSGMSKRSNYAFDFIRTFSARTLTNPTWNASGPEHTVITLVPGIDVEAFEKKLFEHDVGEARNAFVKKIKIKPITKIRYTDQKIEKNIQFQHIVIFAVSGVLVILCSLFNYLTLFISRFRIRQKELALRMLCGASGRSLLAMLSVECMLTLFFAVTLGCMLTQLVHNPFLMLSDIQMRLSDIYRELLMYVGGVILVSMLTFWLLLVIFRNRNMDASIRRSNHNMSRKISAVVQLIIGIGFAFCTTVILKQMYFLHHTDELGFSFQNRGSLTVWGKDNEGLANRLKQIPEIMEVVDASGMASLFPQRSNMSQSINT